MTGVLHILSGALLMGYSICALFFFRFWSKTGERLFVYFGAAFLILAAERIVLFVKSHANLPDDHPQAFLLRLVAFAVIMFGIRDKNRKIGN